MGQGEGLGPVLQVLLHLKGSRWTRAAQKQLLHSHITAGVGLQVDMLPKPLNLLACKAS